MGGGCNIHLGEDILGHMSVNTVLYFLEYLLVFKVLQSPAGPGYFIVSWDLVKAKYYIRITCGHKSVPSFCQMQSTDVHENWTQVF